MAGMNTQFFKLNAFDWISIDILLSCNVGHQKLIICSVSQQQLLKLFWQEAISCMQNVPLRGHQWTIIWGIRPSFILVQKRPCTVQYFKWMDLSRKRNGDLIDICALTRVSWFHDKQNMNWCCCTGKTTPSTQSWFFLPILIYYSGKYNFYF